MNKRQKLLFTSQPFMFFFVPGFTSAPYEFGKNGVFFAGTQRKIIFRYDPLTEKLFLSPVDIFCHWEKRLREGGLLIN